MASSLIHSLSVLLKLDTSSFKRSIFGAEKTLKGFGKSILLTGGAAGGIAVFNKIGHKIEDLNKERGGLHAVTKSIEEMRESWKTLVSDALKAAAPMIQKVSSTIGSMVDLLHRIPQPAKDAAGAIGVLAATGFALQLLGSGLTKIWQIGGKAFAWLAAIGKLPIHPYLKIAAAVAAIGAAIFTWNSVSSGPITEEIKVLTKEELKLNKTNADLIQGLDDQIATFRMSAREAAIYRAQMAGASNSAIDLAKSLSATITRMEEQKEVAAKSAKEWESTKDQVRDLEKQVRDFGKTSFDVVAESLSSIGLEGNAKHVKKLGEAFKGLQENAKLDEFGKTIHRDLMTPLEMWTEQLADMDRLFKTGRISAEDYARALHKIRTEATPEQGQVQFAGLASAQQLGGISRVGSQKVGGSIANRQLTEQQKTNQLLQTIDLELKRIRATGGGGLA